MPTSYTVEQLPDGPLLDLGESPHWDERRQSLYFVSWLEATVHRFDHKENHVYSASVEGCTCTSFIVPVRGSAGSRTWTSEFVVGDGTRLVLIRWDGVSTKAAFSRVIADIGDVEPGNRWNDGKVDSKGRLHAGTMSCDPNCFEMCAGSFYRFEAKTNSLIRKFGNTFISNGMAWNEEMGKFYHVDSGACVIKQYDVDQNGNLSNEKPFIDFKENGIKPIQFPDGMTIDEGGNLYVAMFHGSKVLKINPQGQIVQEILVPVSQVTSVAFGGLHLDELYVTTASRQFRDPQDEPAGATFKVTGLGVKGTLMYEVEL